MQLPAALEDAPTRREVSAIEAHTVESAYHLYMNPVERMMLAMPHGIHLDLDHAWDTLDWIATRGATEWGPRLRYLARRADIETFSADVAASLPPFVVVGSGDFHHLAAVFLRRVAGPVTVISFDNHPDWDIRPPRWTCGGWVNRALELPHVHRVAVWGCGNFELSLPSSLFANHSAIRSRRLEVHAWAERQPAAVRRRFACMTREDWKQRFADFVKTLATPGTYITIDIDCLRAEEAVTNWENGLFTAADLAWAIAQLRSRGHLAGGDICGAWSAPAYAHTFQRLAGWWDHPRPPSNAAAARQINSRALQAIWPALTSG
jgi:arginase family enzyme